MGHIILDGIKWNIIVVFRIFVQWYNTSLAPARWLSSWKVTCEQWLTGEIKLELWTNKYQKRILRCSISPKCQSAEINFKAISLKKAHFLISRRCSVIKKSLAHDFHQPDKVVRWKLHGPQNITEMQRRRRNNKYFFWLSIDMMLNTLRSV